MEEINSPSPAPCIVRCWFRGANKKTHNAEPICYSVSILEVRERAAPVKLSVSFMPGGVNKGSRPQGLWRWWGAMMTMLGMWSGGRGGEADMVRWKATGSIFRVSEDINRVCNSEKAGLDLKWINYTPAEKSPPGSTLKQFTLVSVLSSSI